MWELLHRELVVAALLIGMALIAVAWARWESRRLDRRFGSRN